MKQHERLSPHTAKKMSVLTKDGGRTTVWAEAPRGLRAALAVLLGRHDTRIVIKRETCAACAEVRYHEHCNA